MSASDPGPTVVVGVDGSGPSVRAVAWAAEEARLRGRPLQIVCVVRQGSHTPGPEEAERVLGRARTIARIGSPDGDVRVSCAAAPLPRCWPSSPAGRSALSLVTAAATGCPVPGLARPP